MPDRLRFCQVGHIVDTSGGYSGDEWARRCSPAKSTGTRITAVLPTQAAVSIASSTWGAVRASVRRFSNARTFASAEA